MKINVNGRELDYDEAIRFIEEEKMKAVLSEKEQKLNEIVKKNLVVVSVEEAATHTEHLVLCFAPEDMKYDYAMGVVEKTFGPRYHLDSKKAFKRYGVRTIDKPEEELISLAKKIYGSEHAKTTPLQYTSGKRPGAVSATIFDYMPREVNAPNAEHRSPVGDEFMQELCNLFFKL